jgi:membrane protein DedA with SNARE-associated domain
MAGPFIDVPSHIGYPLVFGLVAGESSGLPIPGETSILGAGALASKGSLSLPVVIVVAAAAAIIGDNIGYVIGRNFLRRLITGPGRWAPRLEHHVKRGEIYFERHGGKTVFFGRWFPVLRITAAWLAGAHHMPWRRFFVFNALGGIGWAASMSTVGYVAGRQAENLITLIAVLVAVAVLLAVGGHFGLRRLNRSRA